jgi:hypothetical protein
VPDHLQDYGFVDFAQPSAAVAAKLGLEKRSSGKFGSTAAPEPAKPTITMRKATMTVAEKKEQERKEEAAKATVGSAAGGDAVVTAAGDTATERANAAAVAAEGSAPAAAAEAIPGAAQDAEGAADAGVAPDNSSTAAAPASPAYQAVGTAAADAKPVQRPHGQVKLLQVGVAEPCAFSPHTSTLPQDQLLLGADFLTGNADADRTWDAYRWSGLRRGLSRRCSAASCMLATCGRCVHHAKIC